ncbi:Senescence-specific cysteine protease SAG39 [Camellia lanceoleosa]|uniref:Senescence-specific cysteine protease SAG39 n=1 Tax=Camellia lanceoleosa TaxID=1840588 RepID=A0ACC0GE87_9ERIC|nr:Senescence-specific cysteine protease SAG39 [Camellia lanceoleosa]
MSPTLPGASMSERHEQWMADHGRVYKDNAEKEMRFKIVNNNVLFIESFNNAGNQPYKLSINQFADLTNEEFQASHNGDRIPSHARPSKMTPFRYENVTAVPASMDWRKKGAVTPIKDQGQCGKQELVDCDMSGKDAGCGGGYMEGGFAFIVQNKGIATETIYPYSTMMELATLRRKLPMRQRLVAMKMCT